MQHTTFLGGAVATAAALGAATPALAVPTPLAFDHVVIDTPGTPGMQPVSDSTPPLKVTVDLDPATGAFTIQPADFDLPEYAFTSSWVLETQESEQMPSVTMTRTIARRMPRGAGAVLWGPVCS